MPPARKPKRRRLVSFPPNPCCVCWSSSLSLQIFLPTHVLEPFRFLQHHVLQIVLVFRYSERNNMSERCSVRASKLPREMNKCLLLPHSTGKIYKELINASPAQNRLAMQIPIKATSGLSATDSCTGTIQNYKFCVQRIILAKNHTRRKAQDLLTPGS